MPIENKDQDNAPDHKDLVKEHNLGVSLIVSGVQLSAVRSLRSEFNEDTREGKTEAENAVEKQTEKVLTELSKGNLEEAREAREKLVGLQEKAEEASDEHKEKLKETRAILQKYREVQEENEEKWKNQVIDNEPGADSLKDLGEVDLNPLKEVDPEDNDVDASSEGVEFVSDNLEEEYENVLSEDN